MNIESSSRKLGQLIRNKRLVLASQSPRRRELMSSLGVAFEVCVPDASAEPDDAKPDDGESIAQFVVRLAKQKATNVAHALPYPALVIGCDTVADVDGVLLGKPRDRDDAARMLKLLSGRTHSVWSGLCVVDSPSRSLWTDVAESQLTMTSLSEAQLDQYLDSNAWVGKSGAFGYQDGHPWLRIISGTAENVVGLPLDILHQTLQKALSLQ